MKISRFVLIAVVMLTAAALLLPQTQSQAAAAIKVTPQTVTLTEAQINSSFWVTNPAKRSVTNRHVTLGNGTVTISETVKYAKGKTHDVVSVWSPSVNKAGVLMFGFQSVTLDGKPATRIERFRWQHSYHATMVRDAIRDYVRKQVKGTFKYTSITVTTGQAAINVNVYTAK